ncbi:MAG TPA: hypothetical protein VFF78_01930 [Anaerolineaceae bacterium]|nr:hypothetical protein [Anaerolineaceae bacterium]
MAKKAKPNIEEESQQDVQNPEVTLVPEEEQPAPVSLVDEDTEEIPVPVKLVEETPVVVERVENYPSTPMELPAKDTKPGVLKWMFDPATSRGRFMRTFSRWAAIVIGLFALGFLVAYFSLYQPVAQQLESSREEASSLVVQLNTTQGQLDAAQGELTDTKDLLLQSQNGQSEIQAQLTQLDTKRKVLEILYDVTAARMAWMTNDRVVALAFLVNAGEMLFQIRPDIQAKDVKLADFIEEQLNTTLADLKSNAPSAPNGLEKLHRTVQSLERLFEVLSK